jgi:uncharacterized SAM-binding protein YcdF (DUF218 family)
MYAFKQFVGLVIHPGTIVVLIALLAVLMRCWKRKRASTLLFCFAGTFAWLMATPLVGGWLLAPLERQYPPLESLPADARYVVVLGSSYTPVGTIPVTAAIDPTGLQRLVEGVRLHKLLPGSKLVVSGGGISGREAPAAGNALLARALGIPEDAIVQLLRPLDTRSEAIAVSALTGSHDFLLVTSSGHMPRAMEYMRRAGGHAVAAPTGQRTTPAGFDIKALIPSSGGLSMSEDALHEYFAWLGLLVDIH